MPIKVTKTKTYKEFEQFAKTVRRVASREVAKDLPDEILQLLEDGISPTKRGEFKKTYSQRYIRAIINGNFGGGKTISPVNLKLSGQMYRSLKTKVSPMIGRVTLNFIDAIAKKHDQGLDGKPVRRLLPNTGEFFHINIQRYIVQRVRKITIILAKLASDR